MRIDRLDLLAYGPFTEQSLDLADGDYGLHLIYGDNEAGKSTSLRALIAWLFGIPARTNDNFLHSNSQLRIGGKLRLSDASTIEFSRKKGNKDTLLKYGTNEPLDDSTLTPFLPAGIDENIFTKLWGIDHGRLIAGGRELLEQSGDLDQALFSAAVGTANLREVLVDMQNRADEIFKPRRSNAVLNQAIENYKNAQKRIKDANLPVSNWKKLQTDLTEKNTAIEKVEKIIEAKSKVKSRLERVNRVKGALAQRRNVLEKISILGQVVLLPEDFGEKRKTVSENLQMACETKERLETKLLRLKEESKSLNVRNDLLENEDAILTLYKELGAVEKVLKDRPQQDGKRRLLRSEAETFLKIVRPDVDLEQADDLRPLLNNKKWIAGLAQKHSLLIQNKEKNKIALQDIKDEQESLQNEIGNNLQSDIDLNELKAAIVVARKEGDVEQRLTEVQIRTADENGVCQDDLARLGRYTGTIDSVLKLALPVSETLDQFEKENDGLLAESQNTIRKKKEIEEEKIKAEKYLKELLLQSDVPAVSDLEASRDVRNVGWQLIKRKYIEQVDIENDISEYAPANDLPSTYEKKVEQADQISDRLRMDADQVVKRVELESKIENLQSQIDDLLDTLEKVKARQNDFQTRWSAIWEPLKIEAGTPREMKQWLLRVENLVEKIQTAKSFSTSEKKLAEDCERLKQTISNHISCPFGKAV